MSGTSFSLEAFSKAGICQTPWNVFGWSFPPSSQTRELGCARLDCWPCYISIYKTYLKRFWPKFRKIDTKPLSTQDLNSKKSKFLNA
jgi:hypothetical protein